MSAATTAPTLPESLSWTPRMVERFFAGYLEAALWSSMDESNESGGEPLDKNYATYDIPEPVRDRLLTECVDFITANQADLEFWLDAWPDGGPEQAGHDFWLTRNGHGAGFWDRFARGTAQGAAGDRLSDASKVYGEIDLYVHDGQVWAAGYER